VKAWQDLATLKRRAEQGSQKPLLDHPQLPDNMRKGTARQGSAMAQRDHDESREEVLEL
jgi:hypothetical protein